MANTHPEFNRADSAEKEKPPVIARLQTHHGSQDIASSKYHDLTCMAAPEAKSQYLDLFNYSVTQNLDKLYSNALRLTSNDTDAETLITESLQLAWECLDQLPNWNVFYNWLLKILCDRFSYRLRQQSSNKLFFSESTELLENQPDSRTSYEEQLSLGASLIAVNGINNKTYIICLNQMPSTYRLILIMVDVFQFKYAQIVDILKISTEIVQLRLLRSRAIFRRSLLDKLQPIVAVN